ncbi:hypothetical protein [uncultured Draconibacterium sp.]|uniref:hypothetical protein n=1 Tax=uncultured Draconibacterium sp. TaxID=1573823 RepID=UPI0032169740
MIDIQDLEGKIIPEIIDLILEQKSNAFEIYIPKSTALFSSGREAIAIDYNKLAYAGHILQEISYNFSFERVGPDVHKSVLFNVETNDIEGLAKVLLEISFGYVNDCDDDLYEDITFDFDMYAEQYLSDVQSGKLAPCCKYYSDIAVEFFGEE